MAAIELVQAHPHLAIQGVRLADVCPKCASAVAHTFEDYLEPDVGEPYELTLTCNCGHEWEIPVKFTVGAAIVGAQPGLLDALDAAAEALGRTRAGDEIWILCDLAIARQRGFWFMLLGDEYMHRAVPINMPFEIDDAAGHNSRTLTLASGTKVELKTHIIGFAIAPKQINAGG
jgi:hypothetical protein